MKCRKCSGKNIRFTKHMYMTKNGQAYHYKLWCDDCFTNYLVGRNKDVYELVKDQRWIYKEESDVLMKQSKKKRLEKMKNIHQATLL